MIGVQNFEPLRATIIDHLLLVSKLKAFIRKEVQTKWKI